jgi:plastocyanin
MKTRIFPIALAVWVIIHTALTGWTADFAVHMTSAFAFFPDYLEIQTGDTVTWYNDDDTFTHDASSNTGLWNTGNVDFQSSATLQFDTPGTYPYRDTLFFSAGMTGTIKVNAISVPPSPAMLILPAVLPGGAFRFTITNLTVGKTNIIAMSTNLVQWTALATNVPASNTLNFTNPPASGRRFFRSWQIP